MIVTFAAAARRDLLSIFEHLSDRSPAAATRIVDALEARALSLAEHPLRGALVEGSARGWRRLMASPFLILYAVGEDRVTIVHVIHGARDLEALLHHDPAPSETD